VSHADKLLRRPIAEWPLAIQSTRGDLQEIEGELSAMIQRATLLEAYLSHRYNTGCGDQGHEASAKHAQRTLVKVRKALGFSYPANTPLSL
jgi:hypothetical protein